MGRLIYLMLNTTHASIVQHTNMSSWYTAEASKTKTPHDYAVAAYPTVQEVQLRHLQTEHRTLQSQLETYYAAIHLRLYLLDMLSFRPTMDQLDKWLTMVDDG